MTDIPLNPGGDAFPNHVYDALGGGMHLLEKRIGGSILVAEKRPAGGPITLITAGVNRLPVDRGLPVELAVEVTEGQQGAGLIALQIVCDDVAGNRRTPPMGAPWRNSEPFLTGTAITAIMAGPSRWGASLDDVRSASGELIGHVRTLRMLTDAEAALVVEQDWDALVTRAGSIDALLDVTRASVIDASAHGAPPITERPVIQTKLHAQHPPRWLTLNNGMFESVTGLESPEYMDEASNHEIVALSNYLARFPWMAEFARSAREGQSAMFVDASGAFTLEN